MNKKYKVSVIMPVYNVENYLHQCIDSVLNQTLSDIEVICVDDGSTDNSVEILREYEKKDSRVKVICQQNKFAGVARNTGMAQATGEYYVFLDSDDFFEPDMLEAQYNQCKKTGADISICSGDKYDIRNCTFESAAHYLNVTRIKSLIGNNETFSVADVKDMIFFIASPAPWNKMFSAEFVKKHGLQFQDTQRANDSFFVLTSLTLAEKITYVDKVLVHYRTGMTTNLQSNNATSPLDFCKALTAVKERLEKEGIYSRVESGFINQVLSQFDYNFSTLENKNPESFIQLLDKFKNEYMEFFGIKGKDASYFYNKSHYVNVMTKVEQLDKIKAMQNVPQYTKFSSLREDENFSPKVSVVIPVYNVEAYLEECIDSVLNQTISDIEVICVNDGSLDGSLAILERYFEKDNRVSIISRKNSGLSASRNVGMDHSKGKYVYFLDSDDYILPDTFEKLYGMAENENLDILMFGAESFFEDESLKSSNYSYVNFYKRERVFQNAVSGDVMLKKLISKRLYRSSIPIQFFNRQFLLDTGVTFKEGIIHEDELFSTLVLVKARKTLCICDSFYMRRVRADSIMTVKESAHRFNCKFIVYAILLAQAITDNTLTETGRKALLDHANTMLSSAKRTYRQLSKEELMKVGINIDEEFKMMFREMGFSSNSSGRDSRELREIKGSLSYKIGRIITFIPRKIRGGIRCYKENGMRYTYYRALEKISAKLKKSR